jgi:hypothetical protein
VAAAERDKKDLRQAHVAVFYERKGWCEQGSVASPFQKQRHLMCQ